MHNHGRLGTRAEPRPFAAKRVTRPKFRSRYRDRLRLLAGLRADLVAGPVGDYSAASRSVDSESGLCHAGTIDFSVRRRTLKGSAKLAEERHEGRLSPMAIMEPLSDKRVREFLRLARIGRLATSDRA